MQTEPQTPHEKVEFSSGYIPAPVPHTSGQLKPRDFKTSLPAEEYIELERQASARQITPYKLASHVLQAWLSSLNQQQPQHPVS